MPAGEDVLVSAGYGDLLGRTSGRRADRHPEVFVAEGSRAIRQLLDAGWPVRSVLLSESRLANQPDLAADAAAAGAVVYVAARDVLDRVAGYRVHRGALALARRPPARAVGEVVTGARLVLAVEGVNDLENMGSLFRNAAGFGVGAVVLDPTCADPLYRRSVRVSVGHVLRVPFARAGFWPADLEILKDAGFAVAALTPGGEVPLARAVMAAGGDRRWAVMVGAEGDGLSAAALGAADVSVRIPMAPGVDSLNVATAAAVALHRFSGL